MKSYLPMARRYEVVVSRNGHVQERLCTDSKEQAWRELKKPLPGAGYEARLYENGKPIGLRSSTGDDPRYEPATCKTCGNTFQTIDFFGNPHAWRCPNPVKED